MKTRLLHSGVVLSCSAVAVGFLILWGRSYRDEDGLDRGGGHSFCLRSKYGRISILYQNNNLSLVAPGFVPYVPPRYFKYFRHEAGPWAEGMPDPNGTTHHWRLGGFGFSSAEPAAPTLNPDGESFTPGTAAAEWRAFAPHWSFAALFAMPALLRLTGAGRRWRRRRLNRCVDCGYDLRSSAGRCPECGLAIPAKPAKSGATARAAAA